jgi:hypothetical protein
MELGFFKVLEGDDPFDMADKSRRFFRRSLGRILGEEQNGKEQEPRDQYIGKFCIHGILLAASLKEARRRESWCQSTLESYYTTDFKCLRIARFQLKPDRMDLRDRFPIPAGAGNLKEWPYQNLKRLRFRGILARHGPTAPFLRCLVLG